MTKEDFKVAVACGLMVWVGGIFLGVVCMGIYVGDRAVTCL